MDMTAQPSGVDSQAGKALHNQNDFSQKPMVLITASYSLI